MFKNIFLILLASVLFSSINVGAENGIPLPGLPGYYAVDGNQQLVSLTLTNVDDRKQFKAGKYFITDGFDEGKKPIRLHIRNGELFLVVLDSNPNMTKPGTFKLGELARHPSSSSWNMIKNIPLVSSVIGDMYVFKAEGLKSGRYTFYFNDMFQEFGTVVEYDRNRRPRAFYLEVF